MTDKKEVVYIWNKLAWTLEDDPFGAGFFTIARCPRCKCVVEKSKEKYQIGEYKYQCINCDFKTIQDKSIEDKGSDFMKIIESHRFKDAEIVNIDGELIRIKKGEDTDNDYWVDVKLSKNKKGDIQLMVLAGSKKDKDKTQLFLEPKNQKMSFDQNNDHPSKVFTKVIAIFKNSKSKITSKGESDL